MSNAFYGSGTIPVLYRCSSCGAYGCKMWRQYQTFRDNIELMCVVCAGKEEGKDVSSMDEDGFRETDMGKTDQIGWLVPAVPTPDLDTYWGYTSVPMAGVEWWRRLPTWPKVVEETEPCQTT